MVLNGSSGADILTGGAGNDIFVFNTKFTETGVDIIKDFNAPEDTIFLENAVFTKLTTLGSLNPANFIIGSAATDANDYIIYSNATGALLYDADGSRAGAAVKIALLGATTHPTITLADFVVI